MKNLLKSKKQEINNVLTVTVDTMLSTVISPLTERGYGVLIQQWTDGWLLHLYIDNGNKHLTTVGAPTISEAVVKEILYNGN
jgi:hypothetical protein